MIVSTSFPPRPTTAEANVLPWTRNINVLLEIDSRARFRLAERPLFISPINIQTVQHVLGLAL